MTFRPCAIVPVFNHRRCLARVVGALTAADLPVILVDDGSEAATKAAIAAVAAADTRVEVLTLPRNRGKGAAVMAGLVRAGARAFTHALQIDADGQHDLADVPVLLKAAAAHPDHLISGAPRFDASIPAVRFYCRYMTHNLIWLVTLSLRLRDSMCGFRVYPLAPTLALIRRVRIGRRMDFDTDIMTRLYWAGTESLFVPTRVSYPADGVSHYRMVRDNLCMIWLHLRLLGGLLPRIPKLLFRNITRIQYRHWARIAESGSLWGLRFVGGLDRWLGRAASRAVVGPVAGWYFVMNARARRASRQFLAAAGVAPTAAHVLAHFNEFATAILDKALAWYAPARVPVDFSDCTVLRDAVESGRGILLLTAHLGNAEAARALACALPRLRINALVHTRNARKFDRVLARMSGRYPLRLFQVEDFGAETALLLRERIAAGEQVVIAGDRTPVRRNGAEASVDFFGRQAPFPIGPYVLAHVLECPVYLFLCLRDGRGYKVHVEPFAERIRLPRERRMAAAAEWAARYAARLEHYGRRYPLQWYNFYDFWQGALPRRRSRRLPHLGDAAHGGAENG